MAIYRPTRKKDRSLGRSRHVTEWPFYFICSNSKWYKKIASIIGQVKRCKNRCLYLHYILFFHFHCILFQFNNVFILFNKCSCIFDSFHLYSINSGCIVYLIFVSFTDYFKFKIPISILPFTYVSNRSMLNTFICD